MSLQKKPLFFKKHTDVALSNKPPRKLQFLYYVTMSFKRDVLR